MALNVQSIAPVLNEQHLTAALAVYFDWDRNHCFPRVMMWAWEQDFVVVTPSMRVWEIEVKVSMADWKEDLEKIKWHLPDAKKVSRWYYAVPSKLLVGGIPDWVPQHIGVLEVKTGYWGKAQTSTPGDRMWIEQRRKATNVSKFSLSDKWLAKLYRSTYFRFWRVQRPDPMASTFVRTEAPEIA